MAALFEVDDGSEVNALLKTLLEAKFHPDPQRSELQGSPLVARLCERAVVAYAAAQEAGKIPGGGGGGQKTLDFYLGPTPELVLAVVRTRIAEAAARDWWRGSDRNARQDYIRILLSPFVADESLLDRLLEEGGG